MAGVYQIGDHYQFETYRGIQDISAMCRVMYGPDRFERFSPTCVIPTLPSSVKLVLFMSPVIYNVFSQHYFLIYFSYKNMTSGPIYYCAGT